MYNSAQAAPAPRLLLLATQRWPTGARLGLAMHAAGFHVSLWSPDRHPLQLTSALAKHYPFGAFGPQSTLEAAITDASPDLIVPCDDLATHRIQRLAARAHTSPQMLSLRRTIERSFGSASELYRLTARTFVLDAAVSGGLPVPPTTRLTTPGELRAWFAEHGFPAYLKADGTSGGIGVRPVFTYGEAYSAYAALDAPPHALRALKRLTVDRDPTLLGPLVRRQRPSISVQKAVAGVDANSAIFCWRGQVCASICVQVLATRYERGPSTVVRRIEHPGMDHAAHVLAEKLNLTGFFGLDFILDEQTNTPWLLEMNNRATQIAHLALGPGHDLATAAYAAVTAAEGGAAASAARTSDGPGKARPLLTANNTIALFPQEWQRDPKSSLLASAFHDVPWQSPGLVRHYVNERPGWQALLHPKRWRSATSAGLPGLPPPPVEALPPRG